MWNSYFWFSLVGVSFLSGHFSRSGYVSTMSFREETPGIAGNRTITRVLPRTEPNYMFTQLKLHTNLIFESTQNPKSTEPLSSKNPNGTQTQSFRFFPISSWEGSQKRSVEESRHIIQYKINKYRNVYCIRHDALCTNMEQFATRDHGRLITVVRLAADKGSSLSTHWKFSTDRLLPTIDWIEWTMQHVSLCFYLDV